MAMHALFFFCPASKQVLFDQSSSAHSLQHRDILNGTSSSSTEISSMGRFSNASRTNLAWWKHRKSPECPVTQPIPGPAHLWITHRSLSRSRGRGVGVWSNDSPVAFRFIAGWLFASANKSKKLEQNGWCTWALLLNRLIILSGGQRDPSHANLAFVVVVEKMCHDFEEV